MSSFIILLRETYNFINTIYGTNIEMKTDKTLFILACILLAINIATSMRIVRVQIQLSNREENTLIIL